MAYKWQRDGQGTGRGRGRRGWGGVSRQLAGARGPAPAISSAVIKAGAAPPSPPASPHPGPPPVPPAIGSASDFNHGRGFLWRAARAASCLFRLLNSSQTRRCHPSRERGSDTAWRPPGPGLPPLPPASRSPTRMAGGRAWPFPRCWHRLDLRHPTCTASSRPPKPPVGFPALTLLQIQGPQHSPGVPLELPEPWGGSVVSQPHPSVFGSPTLRSLYGAQSSRVDQSCPHHILPAPGARC